MHSSQTTDVTESRFLIEELAPELQRGPSWLREKRSYLREQFNVAPLPRRGLHLWRYTDPETFLLERTEVIDAVYSDNFARVEKIAIDQFRQGKLAALVTDLGGREISVLISEEARQSGLQVCSLSDAVESERELVEKHLYGLVNAESGKFEAMNGALFNDGIFIHVPDGVIIDKPLHLLREAGQAGSAQFPRLLVVAGRNAEVTIIDEYGGGASNIDRGITYANGAVELFGAEESRTRYVQLQRYALGTNAYLSYRARIERGASILTVPLSFGASTAKQSFAVSMDGPGARSQMYGLLFGSGRQHFDNHTRHHHTACDTNSFIDFKVVVRDKATSAYTGLIRIENKAQRCEAYQTNRNLLLNKGAKAETIPELEILNQEVSCSHGATIGPLDLQQLFYLKSRGIEETEAVRMIVSGFIASTLKQVPEDLSERISEFVAQRLENL